MPRGDGTGPNGMGPMTGRAAGYCAGYSTPGFANPIGGFGRGRGFWGRGRGWFGRGRGFGWARSGYWQPPAWQTQPTGSTDEIELLKQQAQDLKDSLDQVNSRIEQLSQNP